MQRKKREFHSDLPKRSDPDYMKKYREKFKEEHREKRKLRYIEKKNDPNFVPPKYDPIKAKQYRIKNIVSLSERQWKGRGIKDFTYEKYIKVLNEQNFKCKICEKQMLVPHVDHDHKTGLFRGILCVACNNGLGIYEKRKNNFEEYLKNFSKMEIL